MAKKIKKYKVGIDSETYAISMVEAPAIESDFVALSKEEEVKVFLESDERHMVYGAALIPDKDIYRNNGEQEFYISFTKESIERMSQDFMKNYRQNEVTLDHEEMANDITITESWLVEDPYKDKANALGINVPKGTWMIGMKVNQIDVWERVKSGELKGFSVESMISLEEFSKNDNNMNIETNDMGFWNKMKSILTEVFTSTSLAKQEEVDVETSEATKITPNGDMECNLEEQAPTVEEPTVVETNPEPQEPIVEPKVEEVKEEVKEEPKEAGNESKPNPLEELVKSLTDEVKALKEMNEGLNDKIKNLEKTPSTQPVNTNAKPKPSNGVDGSAYQNWREQMRNMMGY